MIICPLTLSIVFTGQNDRERRFLSDASNRSTWRLSDKTLLICRSSPTRQLMLTVSLTSTNVESASLLDKHALLRNREITVRLENFWGTGEIKTTRRTAQMVERRWRSRRLEVDKQLLWYWRDYLVRLWDEAKVMKLSALISECGTHQKALFRVGWRATASKGREEAAGTRFVPGAYGRLHTLLQQKTGRFESGS